MPLETETINEPPSRNWFSLIHRFLMAVQDMVDGFLFTVMVSAIWLFAMVGSMIFIAIGWPHMAFAVIYIPVAIGNFAADSWLMHGAWNAQREGHQPIAPYLALKQPVLPVPLRPLLAIIWLAHALFGCVIAITISQSHDPKGWGPILLFLAISWTFAYLTFGYFMLAVGQFSRKPASLGAIWKMRHPWALALAILPLVIPRGIFVE